MPSRRGLGERGGLVKGEDGYDEGCDAGDTGALTAESPIKGIGKTNTELSAASASLGGAVDSKERQGWKSSNLSAQGSEKQ